MSASYDDYHNEYNAHLSRIRSFLAGTRNRSTLTECERLIDQAKQCATAMQGLAEVEGDSIKATEAQQMLQRDISPLQKEIKRALLEMGGREELFSQPNAMELTSTNRNYGSPHSNTDMEALISSSDDLLRESQSILAETEQIGTTTLHQMGQQREQLHNTNQHLEAVQRVASQAKMILTSMSRRAWRSKMALYCMIVSLVFANIYVLYRIYKKKTHHDD